MKFKRLAVLECRTKLPDFVFGMERFANTILACQRIPEQPMFAGIETEEHNVHLMADDLRDNGGKATRASHESVIETWCAIASIRVGAACSLSSPLSCLALAPETAEEAAWIRPDIDVSVRGLKAPRPMMPFRDLGRGDVAVLQNRQEALAMVARATSADTLPAYRELVQFFEYAFGMPFIQSAKKIAQFLKKCAPEFNYERSEVDRWSTFRHGAMHADGKVTMSLTSSADVEQLVPRMLQAAMLTLVNKERWRSRDAGLRARWRPTAGYNGPGLTEFDLPRSLFGTDAARLSLDAVIYDYFGAWRLSGLAYTPGGSEWVLLPQPITRETPAVRFVSTRDALSG